MIPEYFIIILLLPYFGLMLFFAMGFLRQQLIHSQTTLSKTSPGISVVVAARNEAEGVSGLLTALQNQKTPPDKIEIIMVDDHSEDGTAVYAETFQMPFTFRVIRSADAGFATGKKGALDGGIRMATHPVVLITDADATPPEAWTEVIRNVFDDPDCVFAAGLVKYRNGSGFIQALECLDFYGLVASGAGAAGVGFPFMCNAANMAFRRSAYLEVEGMASHVHRSSGDDVLLLHRMIARYGRQRIRWYVTPDSITETNPAGSFRRYFVQRVRWASKGGDYRNLTAVVTSIIVLLSNAILVSSLVMAMLGKLQPWIPVLLFMLKGVADLPLLWMVTRKFQQQKLLWWFVPTTIFYPFVTVSAGIASFFWKPKWKGREIR